MDFSRNLNESILACSLYDENKIYTGNISIYPFTTERISGYINEFELENKSLLTIGSSGDQVINAVLHNCKDITLYDINPYSKYYYYLKCAALISLTYNEFLEFLRFREYIEWKDNLNVFNLKSYNKLKDTLKLLDYESFLYFDELFNNFSNLTIRKVLFEYDEDDKTKINNDYLNNNILYGEAKQKIKKAKINFICADIFDINDSIKYDNIWLSNVLTWFDNKEKISELIDKAYSALNEDGKLLVSYLYSIRKEYNFAQSPIYNLDEVYKDFLNYNLELKEFDGVSYDSFDKKKRKDAVLILKKVRTSKLAKTNSINN